jgi:flagellar biosynthesis chaperone FliJ
MNLTFTGSDPNNVLKSQLNSEKNTSQTNIAQNKNLSEQLSQLKNTLDGSIKNLKQLQDEVENQNKIKQNIDYYLADYGNSSDSTKEIDELIGALIENNNE